MKLKFEIKEVHKESKLVREMDLYMITRKLL